MPWAGMLLIYSMLQRERFPFEQLLTLPRPLNHDALLLVPVLFPDLYLWPTRCLVLAVLISGTSSRLRMPGPFYQCIFPALIWEAAESARLTI